MGAPVTRNEIYLSRIGVRSQRHQQILIDALPCGIETVREAWKDRTPYQINGPRAIMVCSWKGMVSAFHRLEATIGD